MKSASDALTIYPDTPTQYAIITDISIPADTITTIRTRNIADTTTPGDKIPLVLYKTAILAISFYSFHRFFSYIYLSPLIIYIAL